MGGLGLHQLKTVRAHTPTPNTENKILDKGTRKMKKGTVGPANRTTEVIEATAFIYYVRLNPVPRPQQLLRLAATST